MTTDDRERDEILHQKIQIFRWVKEEHLDIPIAPHNDQFLDFAKNGKTINFIGFIFVNKRIYFYFINYLELLKINHFKAPRDKLICILNCCKVIFGKIQYF